MSKAKNQQKVLWCAVMWGWGCFKLKSWLILRVGVAGLCWLEIDRTGKGKGKGRRRVTCVEQRGFGPRKQENEREWMRDSKVGCVPGPMAISEGRGDDCLANCPKGFLGSSPPGLWYDRRSCRDCLTHDWLPRVDIDPCIAPTRQVAVFGLHIRNQHTRHTNSRFP